MRSGKDVYRYTTKIQWEKSRKIKKGGFKKKILFMYGTLFNIASTAAPLRHSDLIHQ